MKIYIGRVEGTFVALLIVFLLLSFVPVIPGVVELVVRILLTVLGVWVLLRIARRAAWQILWRLRNRLVVAYLFIALVPVVLITMLVGLGTSLAGGQIAIYLVTSELERRTTSLRGAIEFLTQDDAAERAAPVLERAHPGLELLIEEKTEGKPDSRWTYPADASLAASPRNWKPGSGLLLKENQLFGWAYTVRGNRRVMALIPVTREFLGDLAPDVCESMIFDMGAQRSVLHPSLPDAPPSHNRFPPAVNQLDFEIRWGAPVIPVHFWEDAGKVENEWLTVRTRPSAILRTIFSQTVDWASGVVPMLFFTVAILFLVAETIALVIGISMTRTITGAVHNLYEGTLRASGSDFSHRIPINGKDQLAELAVSFNHMTENMERLLIVEKERERLHAELEIAREVQNQLYPRKKPVMTTLTVTAACNPARMVSGDYYDYQQLGHDKMAIAIGDVAGKGISAALLMATVQSSFRAQIRACMEVEHAVSTSGLVSKLNLQLHADTAPEKFATFYLGVYDEASSTLTYTNAGHLPPILIREGKATRMEVNGMVVGAFSFARYGESQIRLEPGDLVVFFTDGISEPEDPYGEMYGEERLVELLLKNAHLEDAALIDRVMDAVKQWTASDELQDDMTIVLCRKR